MGDDMYGLDLPEALEVGGKKYKINSDFRTALIIFEAFDDPDLDAVEKAYVCLNCLYVSPEDIPPEHMQEAVEQAYIFLNCGEPLKSEPEEKEIRTIDWQKDRKYIFPAVSRVLGVPDIRQFPVLHWWTFYGAFCELPEESTLGKIMELRQKAGEHKLSKEERAFVKKHSDVILIHTPEEQAEIDETEAFIKELTEK